MQNKFLHPENLAELYIVKPPYNMVMKKEHGIQQKIYPHLFPWAQARAQANGLGIVPRGIIKNK